MEQLFKESLEYRYFRARCICGFDGVQRSSYFEGEQIRNEVLVRVGKLKNGKAAGKDEITGEMAKSGGGMVED